MLEIGFFAPGLPAGQPRVKARRMGGFVRMYTPGTADAWKAVVRAQAEKLLPGVPAEGPVWLRLDFKMPRPKSHYRKGVLRHNAPVNHVKKPDLDNLVKAVMDALTATQKSPRGAWRDDDQVCIVEAQKSYSDAPGCQISVIFL